MAILVGLVLFVSACASSTVSVNNPSEYHSGNQLAEKLAKQDAIKEGCAHVYPLYRSKMYENLNPHLKSVKEKHSDSFVQGFSYGYKKSFREYIDLYCGH